MQKIEIARNPLRSGLLGGHCGGCTNSNMGQSVIQVRVMPRTLHDVANRGNHKIGTVNHDIVTAVIR